MHSSVLASGSTKQASPTLTSSPSMMARVSGRRRVTLVPWPGLLATSMAAAQALHLLPHHIHAHAAAGDIGDLFGGRKAGLKDQREDLGFGELRVGSHQPSSRRRAGALPRASMPPPSSETPISTLAPECRAER